MRKLLFLSLFILLIGTGCKRQKPVKKQLDDVSILQTREVYSYESNADVSFVEPGGTSVLYYKNGYSLTYEGNQYLFSHDTAEEERDEFVTRQIELLNFLKEQGVETTGYIFYIVPDYVNRVDDEKKAAYYGITTRASMTHILATLQVIYGQYTNYGILYSMACDIGTQLGWKLDSPKITDENFEAMIQFMKDNPLYIALVYPCFTERYSSLEAIEYSQLLAQIFYNQYSVNKEWYHKTGKELEKEFILVVETFIQEHQLDYEFLGSYQYSYLGNIFPIGVRTDYADIRIHNGYEKYLLEHFPFYSVNEYSNVVSLLNMLSTDIRIGRELLSFHNPKRIEIEFNSYENIPKLGLNKKVWGLYFTQYKKIYMITPFPALHEYMHYIYDMTSMDYRTWATETFAEYFSLYSQMDDLYSYTNKVIPMIEQYLLYQEDIKSANESDRIRAKENYDNYDIGKLEKALAFLKIDAKGNWSEDKVLLVWKVLIDIFVYENKLWNGPINQLSNTAYLSIGCYLNSMYGQEKFVTIILSEAGTKKITGKTDDELKEDWKTYLLDTYSYLYNE